MEREEEGDRGEGRTGIFRRRFSSGRIFFVPARLKGGGGAGGWSVVNGDGASPPGAAGPAAEAGRERLQGDGALGMNLMDGGKLSDFPRCTIKKFFSLD